MYGALYPWQYSDDALSKYDDGIALLVGSQSKYHDTEEQHRRTYLILFPNNLTSKTIYAYADARSITKVNEYDGGFLIMLITYVVLLFGAWWYWIKPKTHNNSSNSTGAKNAPSS